MLGRHGSGLLAFTTQQCSTSPPVDCVGRHSRYKTSAPIGSGGQHAICRRRSIDRRRLVVLVDFISMSFNITGENTDEVCQPHRGMRRDDRLLCRNGPDDTE
jgi:hypothetical protein